MYTIGISSGAFGLVETAEKQSLMTIPRKIFAGGLEGVTFTQVDLESITEFNEPNIDKEVKKIKDLGIKFGFHGEFYRGNERPLEMLDSAIEAEYIHSHERLIQHIDGCGKLGGEYVNFHPSQTAPFIRLGTHLEPSKMVDPSGRPLRKLLEDNDWIMDWIIEEDKEGDKAFLWEFLGQRSPKKLIEEQERAWLRHYLNLEGKEPSEDVKKKTHNDAVKEIKNYFLDQISTSHLSYGPERAAYYIIAKWMQENNDPLWKQIVGKNIEDKDLPGKQKEWVPAVSAKYIWGHFNPKEKQFPDPKPLLDKYKLYICFEAEMGAGGTEGMSRFYRPRDMIILCKNIKSKFVSVCIDFEHILSQNVDPKKEIESISYGDAKYVKLCHLGFPTSLAPAHMPIPLGSGEQLWLYERLFDLRKKGFVQGWMIFERAGAPRENVIIVLRLIKHYLEKDIEPKKLPLEFFGMKELGPEIKRQELAIRDHALDPLRGMLQVPEEEYTFLSSEAVKKGKAEEWKKEKFK
jgi:sugar phosphate isomerase/epimerase